LTTGVLVETTGESAWTAGLMTGATVFVTGADAWFVTGAGACPAAGTTDAVGCCAVAELPFPTDDCLPAPEEPL
jgi:hypothetical protein